MNDTTRSLPQTISAIGGLAGAAIIILASFITMIPYHDEQGASYSILNHFISELGNVGVSRFAWLFNAGLILGGLGLLIFMAGLGVYLRHWLALIASGVGVYAGVACILVGVYSMEQLAMHARVAMAFFRAGLVSVFLFTVYILFAKSRKLPRWLLIPAILTAISFFVFLYVPLPAPEGGMEGFLEDPVHFDRPAVWPSVVFEWAIFFTIIAWVGLTSFAVWRFPLSDSSGAPGENPS